MSVSFYSKCVLGFKVTREDFIRQLHPTAKTCDHGHEQPATGPAFCSLDGTRFRERCTEVPRGGHEMLENDNLVHDVYDDEETLICGITIGVTCGHQQGASVVETPWERVGARYEKVKQLQGRLEDASGRPISIYTWLGHY